MVNYSYLMGIADTDETEWSVVSTTAEFLTAINRQDKNIFMKMGIYTITSAITPYDGLKIVGEGDFINDGTNGVKIINNTTNQIFNYETPGWSSAWGGTIIQPQRGDTIVEWSVTPGEVTTTGMILDIYGDEDVGGDHLYRSTTDLAIDGLKVGLHTPIAHNYSGLSVYALTDFISNFRLENISLESSVADGNGIVYLDGFSNCSFKRISKDGLATGPAFNWGIGLDIDEVQMGRDPDGASKGVIAQCTDVKCRNLLLPTSFEALSTASHIIGIDRCINVDLRDCRRFGLGLAQCTQLEMSNVHTGEIADKLDLSGCFYFTLKDCSINGDQAYVDLNSANHFKIDNVTVNGAVTVAFETNGSDDFIITNCSAPNATTEVGVLSATNYKIYGNEWQGDVVHVGEEGGAWTVVSTAAELIAATTVQKKNIFIENGNYDLGGTQLDLYDNVVIKGENLPSDDDNTNLDGVYIYNETGNCFVAASDSRDLSAEGTFYDYPSETLTASGIPARLATEIITTASPATLIPAGSLVVVGTGTRRELNKLDRDMTTSGTTMYLKDPVLWNDISSTTLNIFRNPVKNVTLENILTRANSVDAAELDYVGIGLNGIDGVNLKSISSHPTSVNQGPTLFACYNINIDDVDGHYGNWYGMEMDDSRHITVGDISSNPSVGNEYQNLYTISCSEVRFIGGTLGTSDITQCNNIEFIGVATTSNPITNIQKINILGCKDVKFTGGTLTGDDTNGGIILSNTEDVIVNGVNFPDRTANLIRLSNTNTNLTIANCIAPSLTGDIWAGLGTVTGLKEHGNSWQGDVVHAGEEGGDWTVVSTSTEFTTALTAQKKKIYMEKGIYNITTPVLLYDNLHIKGDGIGVDEEGSDSVVISLNSNRPVFHYSGQTTTSGLTATATVDRGLRKITLTTSGTVAPAEDTIVQCSYESVTLHKDLAAEDTDIYLSTPTASPDNDDSIILHTGILHNVVIENLFLTATTDDNGLDYLGGVTYEPGLISVDGFSGLKLKNTNCRREQSNKASIFNGTGLEIDSVYCDYYIDITLTVRYVTSALFNDLRSVVDDTLPADAYYGANIEYCTNFVYENDRSTMPIISYCSQFEMRNCHYPETGANEQYEYDFDNNHHGMIINCSTASTEGYWKLNTTTHMTLIDCYTDYTGNGAFYLYNNDYCTIMGCEAPNASNPIDIGTSTNYKVFGNGWQGDVLHEGIDTGVGASFPGRKATGNVTIIRTSGLLGKTITVGSETFTAVSGTNSGNNFQVVDNDVNTTAFNFQNRVNANATLTPLISTDSFQAESSIQIIADAQDSTGNSIALSTNYSAAVGVQADSGFLGGGLDSAVVGNSGDSTCHIIGRDAGITSTSVDSVIINSDDSYIIAGAENVGIICSEEGVLAGASYSTIIGGATNELVGGTISHSSIISGDRNVINGNAGNSVMVAGAQSILTGGSHQVMIATDTCRMIDTGGWAGVYNSYQSEINSSSYNNLIFGTDNSVITEQVSYCTILGGAGNFISGASQHSNTIGGKDHVITDSEYATCLGGQYNFVIGSNESGNLFGGDNHIEGCTGGGVVIVGGGAGYIVDSQYSSQVAAEKCGMYSSQQSTIISAAGCHINNSDYCIMSGKNATLHDGNDYQFVTAIGASSKRRQSALTNSTGITTTSTPVTLTNGTLNIERWANTSTGYTAQQVQVTNAVYSFEIDMVGLQTAATSSGTIGDVCSKKYQGLVKNLAGTTTIVGEVTETSIAYDTEASSWGLTFTPSGETLIVAAVGQTGKTIEFFTKINLVELASN